jgi:crotonobetainyl-CoA:carnitine CoA-transferase CaiB-like acyl-CoA transferase
MLVMNLPQKAALSMGIDYATLRQIRADIIVVHITSFGNEGPYSARTGFDAIAQVMSGGTHLSGWPGEPMKSAAPWVDMTTGNHATIGALAALLHRKSTGEGQYVEINLWQSALSVVNYFLMEETLTGIGRAGIGNRAPSGGPADLVATTDGAIYVAVLGNPMFQRYAELVGHPELVGDDRFLNDELRATNGETLSQVTAAWSAGKTTAQALDLLATARIPAGPLLRPSEILAHEHVLAAGYVTWIEVPGLLHAVPYIRPAYRLSASPAMIENGPPLPGEHTDSILQDLGYSTAEIDELRSNSVI